MLVFDLALKSLRNRVLTTSLTIGSIALSVALLVGVENVRVGMRESFSNTISQTDLVVGTRGGTIQLLLYSVFGMGSPTANLDYATYRQWAEHPAVAWTIPYALGDSHQGFRVIGTDESFYERYRYRGGQPVDVVEGRPGSDIFDVTLGADVPPSSGTGSVTRSRSPMASALSASSTTTTSRSPLRGFSGRPSRRWTGPST